MIRKIKFKKAFGILLLVFFCSSCGDEDPSAQELAFQKLSGRWSLSSASGILLDNRDVSLNYTGFSLSFTENSYATTNAGGLFLAEGTWEWSSAEATQISLDETLVLTLQELSSNRLRLTFNKSGSMVSGVNGEYVLSLEK